MPRQRARRAGRGREGQGDYRSAGAEVDLNDMREGCKAIVTNVVEAARGQRVLAGRAADWEGGGRIEHGG